MQFLTEALVLRPSDQQARWLAKAAPWRKAQSDWICTLLIGVTTFMLLRFLHFGPIRALMLSLVVLAAAATSHLPGTCRALCADAVMRLRHCYWSNAIDGRRRLKWAAYAYGLACGGLWAIAAAYNVLAVSVLMAFLERPLEVFVPAWSSIAAVLLGIGWPAFIVGEWMLHRGLAR